MLTLWFTLIPFHMLTPTVQSSLYWSSQGLIALLKGTLTVGRQHYSLCFHAHIFFSKHLIICCPPTFPPAIQPFCSDPMQEKQSRRFDRARMKRSHNTYYVLDIRVRLTRSSSLYSCFSVTISNTLIITIQWHCYGAQPQHAVRWHKAHFKRCQQSKSCTFKEIHVFAFLLTVS